MRQRRAATLVEALMAAGILAAIGGLLVLALAQATQAGQRAVMSAQARRLLQENLEQVRSGGGVPSSTTSGPFTITVSTAPGTVPIVSPPSAPDCYGASPCSNAITTSGVPTLTYVTITISSTADGTVIARGTTSTPP